MRKKSTRLLSAALAVCMTVTVLPMSAFASGEEELKSDVSPQKTTAEQSEETGGGRTGKWRECAGGGRICTAGVC